jgi:hypothetical protein
VRGKKKRTQLRIYQIYVPELGTFAKFKVFDPEQIEQFIDVYKKEHKEIDIISFRKKVLDTFVFNLKSEVTDSLRMMSRKAAEGCTDALFNGCIMLNPRARHRHVAQHCLYGDI